MADWFETRFREAGEPPPVDAAFAARVRSLALDEWGAGTASSPATRDDDFYDDDHHPDDLGEIIMLEIEDRTTADEPPDPRRQRPSPWLLAGAAAIVIAVVGGALLVDRGDDDRDIQSAADAPGGGAASAAPAEEVPQIEEFVPLEPGRWYVDPDGNDATPLRVSFDIPADGWVSWLGAANFSGQSHVALSTMTVDNLSVDACTDHAPRDPAVGPTVDDLATALTQLPPFQVTSPPRDVTVLGYSGRHLQITVPDLPVDSDRGDISFAGCTAGNLTTWYSPLHDGGASPFFGYNGEPGRTEDFWILDVDGTRLVLSVTSGPGSLDEDVVELDAILASLRIEP